MRNSSPRKVAPPGTLGVETLVALRRARDLMDRFYADPLCLKEISRAAGYSCYHFIRVFRAAYGEPPGRYLSRRRVERAQDLLRSTGFTVTEVCHLVGFASLGSFSARFRELTGVSPSEFRSAALCAVPPPVPGCFVLMQAGPASIRKSATVEKPRSRPED